MPPPGRSNPCLVKNGGCEDVCKLNPAGHPYCVCSQDRHLLPDGKQCSDTKQISCPADFFHCISEPYCLPFSLTCDNISQCPDSSDEDPVYCSTRSCPPNFFSCHNYRCISANLTCNGANDCGDGSDEKNCTCNEELHFKCASKGCIEKKFRCDLNEDCPDASDEMGCPKPKCDFGKFNCANTTACISLAWICDGDDDCWDGSDESDCSEMTLPTTCGPDHFQCLDKQCIMEAWRCDKDNDCDDAVGDGPSSDELNCDQTCRFDQFKCPSGECIPKLWQCDGNIDCRDGEDEGEYCSKLPIYLFFIPTRLIINTKKQNII